MKFKLVGLVLTLAAFVLTGCETSIPEGWTGSDMQSLSEPIAFDGELHSKGAYVIDLDSDEVMFAKNEKEKLIPASTIKIMTALLTLEKAEDLEELVQIPEAVFAGFDNPLDPNTVGGSLSRIIAGQDNVTYLDCLYGLMLSSGNEAANILAYNIGGGDIAGFVAMMNARAVELGCSDTVFTNAHGLLEGGISSTARDLAVITKYAYQKFPLFRELCGASEYAMPGNKSVNPDGYRIRNSNGLLRDGKDNIYYRSFIRGIKNGALDEIWVRSDGGEWERQEGIANLISLGTVGGKSYIIVTLEAPYKTGELETGESRLHYSYLDHLELYEWLFGEAVTADYD